MLPELDVDAFELFLEFLYSNNLLIDLPDTRHVATYIKLYGFAQQICQRTLMDRLITAIILIWKGPSAFLELSDITLAYQCTPPGSRLWDLMADCLYAAILQKPKNVVSNETLATLFKGSENLTIDVLTLMRGDQSTAAQHPIKRKDCD